MLSVRPQRWLQMESRSAIWNMLVVCIYIYIAKLFFDSAYFFFVPYVYIHIYLVILFVPLENL